MHTHRCYVLKRNIFLIGIRFRITLVFQKQHDDEWRIYYGNVANSGFFAVRN